MITPAGAHGATRSQAARHGVEAERPPFGSDHAEEAMATDTQQRAGWWFWGPLVWGAFFLILGVGSAVYGFTAKATSHDVTSGVDALGRNYTSDNSPTAFKLVGGLFVLMGLGGLGMAWYIRWDINSESPAHTEADLRRTGLLGQATITSLAYVAGSSSTDDGTTLLDLDLAVSTAQTGSITVHTQSRAPLGTARQVQVGSNVTVFVDPIDHNHLLVDWAALAVTQA